MTRNIVLVHTGRVDSSGLLNYRIKVFDNDTETGMTTDEFAFLQVHGMTKKNGGHYIKGSKLYLQEHLKKQFNFIFFIY